MYIEQPIFESRDSKHLFLPYENGTSRSQVILQHPFLHLSQSSQGDSQLWLSCPSIKPFGLASDRILNQYSVKKKSWLTQTQKTRELHKYGQFAVGNLGPV